MDLLDFVRLIATRVNEAGGRGDTTEAVRLLRVLRDVAEEQAVKLERESVTH